MFMRDMKLLILTQKVDINDPILGFFHRWTEEFSKHTEQITVIALGVGEYHLPKNVRVFSLGKEKKRNSLQKLYTFYFLLLTLRKEYDAVFVHMNQEYILFGGIFWKLLGKKITMWRNHSTGNFLTRIAMAFSDKIFCTSKYSFTAHSKKTILMPAGIDTDVFKRDKSVPRVQHSILCLGRIAPVKNIDVLINALLKIDDDGYDFSVSVVGDSIPKDEDYLSVIKNKAKPLLEKGKLEFLAGIPNNKAPEVYSAHEIFVNLTDSGSFDKTILEAMACECLTIVSNQSFAEVVPYRFIFTERDSIDLSRKVIDALLLKDKEKEHITEGLRKIVSEQHSLALLTKQLIGAFVQ